MAAQHELGYKKVVSVVGDVSTRWNSSLYAWQRLLILKRAIIFLPTRLQSDLNADVKKDGEKLERIMLTKGEWELLNKLVDILDGFELVTRLLSGAKYVTISLMYPAISRIIQEIKPNNEPPLSITDIEEDLEEVDLTTVFENIEEIIGNEEDLIEVDGVNNGKRKVDISKPLDLEKDDYLKKVKQTMYESMAKYWKTSATIAMVACVLDPRFKKLRFTTESIRRKINKELYDIFAEEKEIIESVSSDAVFLK